MNTKTNVVKLKTKATDKQIREALESGPRASDKHNEAIKKAYETYYNNGWTCVRLRPGKKNPVAAEWQNITREDKQDFVDFDNIGVVIGEPSRGLIDIDLDHPDILAAAEYFLPHTNARFGRYYGQAKQSLGHWLYRCYDSSFYKITHPKHGTLVELRGGEGGKQTVFPPSYIYDDDLKELDLICWDGGQKAHPPEEQTIPVLECSFIKARLDLMAATVMSAEFFKPSAFHDDMLAWCGLLAKAGYSIDDALLSVRWLVEKTGQTGIEDREASVRDTYRKIEDGKESELISVSRFRNSGWDEAHIKWLQQRLHIKSMIEDDGRPVVKVIASKETKLFDDTLDAMIRTKKFYSMAGPIVVINREVLFTDKTTGEIKHKARITPLAESVAMGSWLTREIIFVQSTLDKVSQQFVDQIIKAPTSLATELANPHTFRGNMPKLTGLSNIPTITTSGRIVDEPWGYDEELQLFFSSRFGVRKLHPDEALHTLQEPFVDFPFSLGNAVPDDTAAHGKKFGRYYAAAISAILTAVVRPAIDICPAYFITSSQFQDGKSVMSNLIAAAVGMEGGQPNSPLTRGGSDEEQEKQISSVLAVGKRVVVYDNHDGEFRSAALTETLTSSQPEFRVLGKSEIRSVPNRSMFVVNGVNIVLAEDLQTRSIMIRLARNTLSASKKFRHMDVVGWCEENSEQLVSAAISLIDWALQQDDGNWRPTHRFKMWDKLVRRTILLACGVDISPPAGEDEDKVIDPMEEVKREFMDWVKHLWDTGVRDIKARHWFRGRTIAEQIAPGSVQEGWVKTISRRPNQALDVQIGRCLATCKDVPFVSQDQLFKISQSIRDGVTVYKIDLI